MPIAPAVVTEYTPFWKVVVWFFTKTLFPRANVTPSMASVPVAVYVKVAPTPLEPLRYKPIRFPVVPTTAACLKSWPRTALST